MVMKKLWALLLLAAIAMTACSAPSLESVPPSDTTTTPDAVSTVPTETGTVNPADWMPTYGLSVEPLPLPEVETENGFLEILDGRNNLVLCAEQLKILDQATMSSYFLTKKLGIYDTGSRQYLCTWVPETEGWYYAGGLISDHSALCAVREDYWNTYPAEFALIDFGDTQKRIENIVGEIQAVRSSKGGTVWVSSQVPDGSFGIGCYSGNVYSDVLSWECREGQEPMDGQITPCGVQTGFSCVTEGQCVLMALDEAGTGWEYRLEYLKERLDSFCLTPCGIVACLSVNQDTPDAHRALVLITNGDQCAELRRGALDGALYQMRFAGTMGVAVDYRWGIHVLAVKEDRLGTEPLNAPELAELLNQNVRFFTADEASFYFFYPDAQRLFRVILAPSA